MTLNAQSDTTSAASRPHTLTQDVGLSFTEGGSQPPPMDKAHSDSVAPQSVRPVDNGNGQSGSNGHGARQVPGAVESGASLNGPHFPTTAPRKRGVEPRPIVRGSTESTLESEVGLPSTPSRHLALQSVVTAAPLVLVDLVALAFAVLAAHGLMVLLFAPTTYVLGRHLAAALSTVVMVFSCFGLYPACGMHPAQEFRRTFLAIAVSFALLLIASLTFGRFSVGEFGLLLTACSAGLVTAPALRQIARSLLGRCSWWGQRALIIGDETHGGAVCEALRKNPSLGLRPVILMHPEVATGNETADRDLGLGRRIDSAHRPECVPVSKRFSLASVAAKRRATWAIVAMPDRPRDEIQHMVDLCGTTFPNLVRVPHATGFPTLWTTTQDFGGLLGIHSQARLLLPLPRFVKRMMDLALVVFGGLLILPLVLLICVVMKLTSRGPVFYSQQRIGYRGRAFPVWKFRTMVVNAEQVLEEYLRSDHALREEWDRNHKLKDDPRVTALGRLLRTTSLDELPQLWNVLRGEMSLVGPRPLPEYHLAVYGEPFRNLREQVRPGVSGLWQVSGRSDSNRADLEQLDAYYIRNWSPWLDLHILAQTMKAVLLRDGAY